MMLLASSLHQDSMLSLSMLTDGDRDIPVELRGSRANGSRNYEQCKGVALSDDCFRSSSLYPEFSYTSSTLLLPMITVRGKQCTDFHRRQP